MADSAMPIDSSTPPSKPGVDGYKYCGTFDSNNGNAATSGPWQRGTGGAGTAALPVSLMRGRAGVHATNEVPLSHVPHPMPHVPSVELQIAAEDFVRWHKHSNRIEVNSWPAPDGMRSWRCRMSPIHESFVVITFAPFPGTGTHSLAASNPNGNIQRANLSQELVRHRQRRIVHGTSPAVSTIDSGALYQSAQSDKLGGAVFQLAWCRRQTALSSTERAMSSSRSLPVAGQSYILGVNASLLGG
ncbi:hypothetical protein QBC39DRAFT_420260 [Podospora conica]|nr:hypothetical protein QBC39DRAFT_420260 [Schizothecium conicum]